jgi:hypothetical protein
MVVLNLLSEILISLYLLNNLMFFGMAQEDDYMTASKNGTDVLCPPFVPRRDVFIQPLFKDKFKV